MTKENKQEEYRRRTDIKIAEIETKFEYIEKDIKEIRIELKEFLEKIEAIIKEQRDCISEQGGKLIEQKGFMKNLAVQLKAHWWFISAILVIIIAGALKIIIGG